ncbi:MAG: hypothetical protein COV46_03935 [Deltaproteobacteria bacterium CG11_big_fil_rev_8_21_14_0_20_49_13]|nr:MAG: hypothetical protein COV46_03935 [Deltaproteobacteria bacterium CG11_big_fil_rev_8_21_14_0_20_49_13]
MPKARYRLQALLVIKERVKNRAAEELARAIIKLQEARKKEKELIEEKEKTIKEWFKSRDRMRKEMDVGSVVQEGNVHINFLRKLKEDEEKKQEEIEEQRDVVLECEENVGKHRKEYIEAAKEHQVMVKHKDLWKKKVADELSKKEERELDELGSTIHHLRKWKGEKGQFTL